MTQLQFTGTLWRSGYRARLMRELFDFPLSTYVESLREPDYNAGWMYAEDRAREIAQMRDCDPETFTIAFGRAPTNFGHCEGIVAAEAAERWRKVEAILAQIEEQHLERGRERDHAARL